jgi:hypothetical protein
MRNLKIALALVVVLAMAGTTFAGITMTVVQQADPAPGLQSWLVKIYGAPQAFKDVNILGNMVHQANKYGDGLDMPTCFIDEVPSGGSERTCDTHFMFEMTGVMLGDYWETNDTSNPAGLTPDDSKYQFGMGDFVFDTGTGFSVRDPLAEGADFMQVVLEEGTVVLLSFWTPVNEVDTLFEQPVGIPEPGTVVMLIAGALCLVVIRFRKK